MGLFISFLKIIYRQILYRNNILIWKIQTIDFLTLQFTTRNFCKICRKITVFPCKKYNFVACWSKFLDRRGGEPAPPPNKGYAHNLGHWLATHRWFPLDTLGTFFFEGEKIDIINILIQKLSLKDIINCNHFKLN